MQFPFEPDDETHPAWPRYALICAGSLVCLLLLYWTAGLVFRRSRDSQATRSRDSDSVTIMAEGSHEWSLPATINAADFTEDEQQYIREARQSRDAAITEKTDLFKEEEISDRGAPAEFRGHSPEYKEEVKKLMEKIAQHREVCRPEYWSGQELIIGTVGLLHEYRVERIVNDREMICRLYGKSPKEPWVLVPLGVNAVWLCGMPTAGLVDGKRVVCNELIAIRGTKRLPSNDGLQQTWLYVEPAHINLIRVDAALGAAAMADDQNPEMHERLNELRKLAGLPLVVVGATQGTDVKGRQQPAQHAWSNVKGFWLSRSTTKDDEHVVLSLSQPSEAENGGRPSLFDQDFAKAVIGRKLEPGEQVFVHDFKVEFLSLDAEQVHEIVRHAKGFWFIRNTGGDLLIGYDGKKPIPSHPLRVGNRGRRSTRRWTPVDGDFIKLVVGRNLTRGERAFVSEPKVESNRADSPDKASPPTNQ
jgi:hypothetical protein